MRSCCATAGKAIRRSRQIALKVRIWKKFSRKGAKNRIYGVAAIA